MKDLVPRMATDQKHLVVSCEGGSRKGLEAVERWHHACSFTVVTIRILLASFGALFFGSTAAFFLLVSVLSIATVALILTGMLLMFGLGVQVGTRPVAPSSDPHC